MAFVQYSPKVIELSVLALLKTCESTSQVNSSFVQNNIESSFQQHNILLLNKNDGFHPSGFESFWVHSH